MNEPVEAHNQPALSDVMLAMDVVDTLRHEDKLVARALNAQAREQALIERVRAAYAAQGIAVSEAMIADGVAALKAREYSYEPPHPGLRTRLLTAWVRRRRIGAGLAVTGVFAALIGGGWYGFVEYPEARQRTAAVAQLNDQLTLTRSDIQFLGERHATLARRWQALREDTPDGDSRRAFERLSDDAGATLASAADALQLATAQQHNADLSVDNFERRATDVRAALTRQQQSILTARAALDRAEQQLNTLDDVDALPRRLRELRDAGVRLAVPAPVDAEIEQRYDTARAALQRGDVQRAIDGLNALQALNRQLEQQFRVRIVSRPGALSGVIREPPNNPRASNYYLIVEALDADNRPVTVAIVSEEDGSSANVSSWGVRVAEAVFDRVRRDKQDDGIIQAAAAGEKRRGYLDIDYLIPVQGGLIHTWEAAR